MQYDLTRLQCLTTAIHTDGFDGSACAPNPGSVCEAEWNAVDTDSLVDCVASGSRSRRYDGTIPADQGVEKTRFPHVRPPHNRHRDAISQYLAFAGGCQERLHKTN